MLGYANQKANDVVNYVTSSSYGNKIDQILSSAWMLSPISASYTALKDANKLLGNNKIIFYTTTFITFGILQSYLIYYSSVLAGGYGIKIQEAYYNLDHDHKDPESVTDATKSWDSMIENLQYWAFYQIGQLVLLQFLSFISQKLHRDLTHLLESRIDALKLEERNLIALTQSEDSKTYSLMLENDMIGRISAANSLLRTLSGTAFTGIISIYDLRNFNFIIPSFIVCFGVLNQSVLSKLTYKTKILSSDLDKLSVELSSKQNNIVHNAQNIVRAGGEEYELKEINDLRSEIRKIEQQLIYWSLATTFCSTVLGYSSFVGKFLILGSNLFKGAIKKEDLALVEVTQSNFNDLIDFKTNHLHTLIDMDNKKERLSKTDKLLKEKAEDSKKLRVEFEPSQKEAVKIKDFVIQINEKDSLTLKEFSLEKGKCYAISGPTGKGKSTFLGKLKGINKDSMLCSGEIIYSAESINEVFSVPQSDYFPLKKSLIEAICYPNTCSEYSRNKISLLLRKSGLANLINRLDEVGDFTNTLSGGQKKIMKIISAILASPRILLLDETLTGLDNEIAIVIQKLIKDYLPNTTVLVVDHSIDENNRKINGKDFYDDVLEFTNGTIEQYSIRQKAISMSQR
jgi:ABC-type uncharacterized transport system fused permease/ATPase subunit